MIYLNVKFNQIDINWAPRGAGGAPMGAQGGDPWDPMGGTDGIPGWALGDPLALGDP